MHIETRPRYPCNILLRYDVRGILSPRGVSARYIRTELPRQGGFNSSQIIPCVYVRKSQIASLGHIRGHHPQQWVLATWIAPRSGLRPILTGLRCTRGQGSDVMRSEMRGAQADWHSGNVSENRDRAAACNWPLFRPQGPLA
jgi:hypothetical protein